MKLCTLKDMVPGSIVELPKAYQSRAGERAIVLGMELTGKNIRANFLRDTMEIATPEALPEDTELAVVDDKVLKQASIGAFVANKLALPTLPMSVGCDPEIFVQHSDGSIFPAWEFMPSENQARLTAKSWMQDRFDVPSIFTPEVEREMSGEYLSETDHAYCWDKVPAYWDGAQAEFAPWAKNCLETLHYGTRAGLKSVLDFARKLDPEAKLTLQNVIELSPAVLEGTDDKYIQFRCSNSYNIYNDPGDGIPNAREYKYRCAGGHIHIGYTRKFTAPGIEAIIRGLDGVVGVAGVSLAAGIDNPERRHTYGRAGEFRLPAHGLEYRVLSNFWLTHPAIAMLVFELSRAAIRLAESGLFNLCWVASERESRDVINNCDVEGARKILQRNAAVIMGMLNSLWPDDAGKKVRELAFQTILNGIETVIPDPSNIEKNWKLDGVGWKPHCRGEGDSWKSLVANHK